MKKSDKAPAPSKSDTVIKAVKPTELTFILPESNKVIFAKNAEEAIKKSKKDK